MKNRFMEQIGSSKFPADGNPPRARAAGKSTLSPTDLWFCLSNWRQAPSQTQQGEQKMTLPQPVRVQLQIDLADIGLLQSLPGLAGATVNVYQAPPPPDPGTVRSFMLQQALGLTQAEARTLLKLLERGSATREELHRAMSPTGVPVTNIKLVDARISNLRKKLAPHKVEIINIHGQGFKLDKNGAGKIQKLLAEAGGPLPVNQSELKK
jgi:hypothetical protein